MWDWKIMLKYLVKFGIFGEIVLGSSDINKLKELNFWN